MAYVNQQGSRRALSVGVVVAVHALIGYGFVTGLTPGWVETLTPPITAVNIFKPVPPIEPPPPPETVEKTEPTIAIRTAPDPLVRVPKTREIAVPITPDVPATPVQNPFGTLEFKTVVPPPPPVVPTAPLAKAVEPRLAKAATIRSFGFGNADYPMEARRAEQSGTTRVRVTVSSAGRATDCVVAQSSGSYALDQAACRLVKSRSRFTPAQDSAGAAVEQSIVLPIIWQLPR